MTVLYVATGASSASVHFALDTGTSLRLFHHTQCSPPVQRCTSLPPALPPWSYPSSLFPPSPAHREGFDHCHQFAPPVSHRRGFFVLPRSRSQEGRFNPRHPCPTIICSPKLRSLSRPDLFPRQRSTRSSPALSRNRRRSLPAFGRCRMAIAATISSCNACIPPVSPSKDPRGKPRGI